MSKLKIYLDDPIIEVIMGFNIDLKTIPIALYEQVLMESDLVPSRMVLKEHADQYFPILAHCQIKNVDDLIQALKNKKKVHEWAEKTGIPEDYLTILIREIKGYQRTPIKLDKFPGIEESTIESLSKLGVSNALHLFNHTLTSDDRMSLATESGIAIEEIVRLTKLVDLSRIRWVNQTFAYVLYEAGYDTVEKVALADPTELFEKVKQLNNERKLFPAHIGLNDMHRCVEFAKMVPFDIEH